MSDLTPTPGQTVGPFFGYALPYAGDNSLVAAGSKGEIRLHGRVVDGAGNPVPDGLIELWQVDAAGQVPQIAGSLRRDGSTFTGWGRSSTDAEGHYEFTTVLPDAPFFALTVFARGLLNRLFTRAYLPSASDDAFLASIPADRRHTLMATAEDGGYVFDIRLQGDQETVFLTFPRH